MAFFILFFKWRDTMKLSAIGLFVTDIAKMVAFYRDIMGLKTDWNGNEPNVEFYSDTIRLIMFPRKEFEKMTSQQYGYPKGHNGTFEIAFELGSFSQVDKEYARVVGMGAESIFAPTTMPWGQRTCYIADPEGNLLEIYSFNE